MCPTGVYILVCICEQIFNSAPALFQRVEKNNTLKTIAGFFSRLPPHIQIWLFSFCIIGTPGMPYPSLKCNPSLIYILAYYHTYKLTPHQPRFICIELSLRPAFENLFLELIRNIISLVLRPFSFVGIFRTQSLTGTLKHGLLRGKLHCQFV